MSGTSVAKLMAGDTYMELAEHVMCEVHVGIDAKKCTPRKVIEALNENPTRTNTRRGVSARGASTG